jgi:hypothetical protein
MFFIIFAVGFGLPVLLAIGFTIYIVVSENRQKRKQRQWQEEQLAQVHAEQQKAA